MIRPKSWVWDVVQVRLIDDRHRMDVDLKGLVTPGATAERGRGLAFARAVRRHLCLTSEPAKAISGRC